MRIHSYTVWTVIEMYDAETAPEEFGSYVHPSGTPPQVGETIQLKWLDGRDAYKVVVKEVSQQREKLYVEKVPKQIEFTAKNALLDKSQRETFKRFAEGYQKFLFQVDSMKDEQIRRILQSFPDYNEKHLERFAADHELILEREQVSLGGQLFREAVKIDGVYYGSFEVGVRCNKFYCDWQPCDVTIEPNPQFGHPWD